MEDQEGSQWKIFNFSDGHLQHLCYLISISYTQVNYMKQHLIILMISFSCEPTFFFSMGNFFISCLMSTEPPPTRHHSKNSNNQAAAAAMDCNPLAALPFTGPFSQNSCDFRRRCGGQTAACWHPGKSEERS